MLYKRKTSFLGDMVVIFVFILIVFGIYFQYNLSEINQIQKINKEYGVSQNNLIPEKDTEYIAKINQINNKKIKEPIIEFIKLNQESENIDKMINLNILENNNCISKNIKIKMNNFILKKDNLELKFIENKDSKKLNKIYWDEYIEVLENSNDYKDALTEITDYPICEN